VEGNYGKKKKIPTSRSKQKYFKMTLLKMDKIRIFSSFESMYFKLVIISPVTTLHCTRKMMITISEIQAIVHYRGNKM
jgi:hypothetical protein